MISERLKPVRFEKGSFITMCAKAEPVAVVTTLHGRDEAALVLRVEMDKGYGELYNAEEKRKGELKESP